MDTPVSVLVSQEQHDLVSRVVGARGETVAEYVRTVCATTVSSLQPVQGDYLPSLPGAPRRLSTRLPDDLVAAIDKHRGPIPRATWIRNVVVRQAGLDDVHKA